MSAAGFVMLPFTTCWPGAIDGKHALVTKSSKFFPESVYVFIHSTDLNENSGPESKALVQIGIIIETN
jgi:hypothetical protein